MRQLLFIIISTALLSGCSSKEAHENQKALTILVDITDSLTCKPDTTKIFDKLGLKEDMWQGVKVTVSSISELDINPIETIVLPSEDSWNSNKGTREAKVDRFKKELFAKIRDVVSRAKGSEGHTILYRSLCRNLNALANSKADYKGLMIFSDLEENDSTSFYSPSVFKQLKTNPSVIERLLERNGKLADLQGIHAYFEYAPVGYIDNARYMTVSCFFARLLQHHNAKVHIGNNI